MEETTRFMDMDDGAKLFVRRWSGDKQPRAVVQIVHGMAEHSKRYGRLAKSLCDADLEVWADDHRGHGETGNLELNPPELGGTLGHCADRDGFFRVLRDLESVSREIRNERPGVPLFLLGHSWGSFLAQAYIEGPSAAYVAGCALSGTTGPGGQKVAVGALIASLVATLKGVRSYSRLLYSLADGTYNRSFRPNKTNFDWLSRDEAEVAAYVADPYCGFPCSVGFYRDLARGLQVIHTPGAIAHIPTNLPILIFSGSADPVGAMGIGVTKLVEAYRSRGIQDLDFILYPDARHEIFNETNRDEVTANFIAWIQKHIG